MNSQLLIFKIEMRFIFITALVFLFIDGKGQSIENEIVSKYNTYWFANPKESAFITTGKRIYYSGNSIECSLSILDQYLLPSGMSEIAYIELIHEKDSYHETYVIQLEKGIGNTKINIPYNAPTGNYQLVAYTNFMKNFDADLQFHRLPIYIQNPREEIQEVVKSITYSEVRKDQEPINNNMASISITNREEEIQVDLSVDEKGSYYLISEGFGSLQFIANVKLRKRGHLSFKNSQFKGSFQRLIMIDENLKVLAAKSFYLPSHGKIDSELNVTKSELNVNHSQNLVSVVSLKDSGVLTDSIDLFRRYYRLYYNIPPWIRLDDFSYDELISDNLLEEYSIYTAQEWSKVLLEESKPYDLVFTPEKELHLKGKIEGDLDELKGCLLDIHFFKNRFEIQYLLNDSNEFDLSLVVPRGKDSFFASIINENGVDVSKNYTIIFDKQEPISYVDRVEMYDKSITDSIISKDIDFNYILSTFDESDKSQRTFWSDERIDLTFKPADYRNLSDFEEFLREAVAAITIVKKNDRRELRVFNKSIRKPYEGAPIIMLNDVIISECDPLFNLDLESVKSLRIINTNESMAGFGSSFRNGVLIVTTFEETKIARGNRHKNFIDFSSYHFEKTINPVSEKFSTTKLFKLNIDNSFKASLPSQAGSYQLNLQSLSKDGTYQFFRKNLKMD